MAKLVQLIDECFDFVCNQQQLHIETHIILPPQKKKTRKEKKLQLLSKLEIWTKFMQSGKTAAMQAAIKELIPDNGDTHFFHIIFCSNNIFLTKQTAARVNSTLKEIYEKVKHFTFTSKDKIKYKDAVEKCKTHQAILCCTNKARLENIDELLREKIPSLAKVIIWMDEAHDKINANYPYLERYSTYDNVHKIIGITATPEPILKKLGKTQKVTFKPLPACDKKLYVGFDECEKVILDYDNDNDNDNENYKVPSFMKDHPKLYKGKDVVIDDDEKAGNATQVTNYKSECEPAFYVHTILENNVQITKKDVLFAPASQKIITHDMIRKVLLQHNFYVFVFNSEGHILHLDEEKEVDLQPLYKQLQKESQETDSQCSVGKLMGCARKIHELTDRPIAITGYLSLGQGNTLCDYDTEFYITKCILSIKGIYSSMLPVQISGRCFGNFKQRKQYTGCTIFARSQYAKQLANKIKFGACSEYALKYEKPQISLQEYNQYLEHERHYTVKKFDAFSKQTAMDIVDAFKQKDGKAAIETFLLKISLKEKKEIEKYAETAVFVYTRDLSSKYITNPSNAEGMTFNTDDSLPPSFLSVYHNEKNITDLSRALTLIFYFCYNK